MNEIKEEIEEIVKKIKQEEENDLFDFAFAQKDNSENVEEPNSDTIDLPSPDQLGLDMTDNT